MTRYVAFLRAINVGGRFVKMDRLRALFESLKLANVETFIASGNVIFDSRSADTSALETKIERRLAKALGYEVATFLRSGAELATVAAHKPFGAVPEGQWLYVGFLRGAPGDPVHGALSALRSPADDFTVHGRELYWLRRVRDMKTITTGTRLEKAVGTMTMRNVTTVRKLAAKLTQAG
jgi:uncharacterized protein (DUF1697 family)